MLIVIGIMLLLVAAAATIMPAAAESRRIREAGRGLNVYLGSARNRAMETGRPCGVIFHCIPGTLSAINLDQCEVPPQYAGQNTNSTASVTLSGAGTVSLTFSDGAFSSTSGVPVYPGDLIQLNGQGVFYTVAGSASNNVDSTTGRLSNVGSASAPLIATFDTTQGQIVPWTTTPTTLPYCIFRSPMKSGATPLQLPSGAVVDLRDSGVGSNYIGATYATMTTFTVLFSPTGAVDRVYYDTTQATVTDPIYLLVGKRDRALNTFVPNNSNESTQANLQDLNNLWVTINSQTGLVSTAPVAVSSGGEASAVTAARQLATQGIGVGGR